MILNVGDVVVNNRGTQGTVVGLDSNAIPCAAFVQWDTGRAGWFDRENDSQLQVLK